MTRLELTVDVDDETADRLNDLSPQEVGTVLAEGLALLERRDELRNKWQSSTAPENTAELGFGSVEDVYDALDKNEISEAEAKRAELKLQRRKGGSAR